MASNSKAVSARLEPSAKGQRAHDVREGPQPSYVDESKSHLNSIIIEPLTNEALRDEWTKIKDRVGKKGKIRSNQNLAYAGIITFGTDAQKIFEGLTAADQDLAFLEVADKIAQRFNTTLTGLVAHRDETAPHCHFQIRGIANDGTMLSQVVRRTALHQVQDIAAEVMSRHAEGIERGKNKYQRMAEGENYAATVNRSVAQLHADLPAEIAEAEKKRDEALEKAANHRRLAEKHRQTATENADKAAKALKNLGIQEARAEKAQEDADSLTEALEGLRSTETTLRASVGRLEAREASLTASVREKDRELLDSKNWVREKNEELDEVTNLVAQKKTKVAALESAKISLNAKLKTLNAA